MKTEQNRISDFELEAEDAVALETLKATASTLPALPPDGQVSICRGIESAAATFARLIGRVAPTACFL